MSMPAVTDDYFPEDASSFARFEINTDEDIWAFLNRCHRHLETYEGRIIIDLEKWNLTVEQIQNYFSGKPYSVSSNFNGRGTGKVLVGRPFWEEWPREQSEIEAPKQPKWLKIVTWFREKSRSTL